MGGRSLLGENIDGRDPPSPPLKRGGGACGQACGRWLGENNVCRLPPVAPLRKGGEGGAGGRLLRGENNVCAPTPVAPLRKGGEGGALADAY